MSTRTIFRAASPLGTLFSGVQPRCKLADATFKFKSSSGPLQTQSRPISSLLSSLPNLNGGPSPPQTIRARRVLSYPSAQVYDLIADVDSYSSFLPYCTTSRVTRWTAQPDSKIGRRWPTLADLTVGWGPFTESYTSRLYCVPGEVVEAVSGSARPTIPADTLRKLGLDPEPGASTTSGKATGIFESLVTRWTVEPIKKEGKDESDVTLSVQFQFANPTLGLAVGALADQKVQEMIEAFESRAKQLHR